MGDVKQKGYMSVLAAVIQEVFSCLSETCRMLHFFLSCGQCLTYSFLLKM